MVSKPKWLADLPKTRRITTWQEALPSFGLVDIFGFIGSGKSVLAWWLAQGHHNRSGLVAAYDMPQEARGLLPPWVHHIFTLQEMTKLPKGALVVVDEGALRAHARQHATDWNMMLVQLNAIARHKGLLVVFIAQSNRAVDVGMVYDAALILLKEPSVLHLRFSRPELRPELNEALEAFRVLRSVKGGDLLVKRATYVWDAHHDRKGLLLNEKPDWWSEDLSTVFATVDVTKMRNNRQIRKGDKKRGEE